MEFIWGCNSFVFFFIEFSGYQGLEEQRSPEMDSVLEQALKEAEDDVTFKKVKRMSYSSNAAGEVSDYF